MCFIADLLLALTFAEALIVLTSCASILPTPSFIGYDSTNDSISAQLSPIPDSNEALTYKIFYASGGEVPANCDSSTSVCTVSNLPPATLYKVYSVICPDGPFNEKVCSEKSVDAYCATKPNKPSILNYASTNESITWEFGAIPESNATLTCKVHDDNGKELVECTDSSMPCMVSSLSPGTGYTVQLMVCVVVPYGYEQCSEKSEEMKCTTRPNPPSNVLVEPVSSSSVRVVLTTPEPATGIERYTVSLDGGDAIPCDIEEDERRRSCTISGLSPGTEYRVNAVSWLGGEFSSVSSEAAQGSGWTKLSKPSSWSYESTNDSITWQFSPSTESNGSLTYKVFDESGQQVAICSSSSLPCMASNLKPATVYPVYFLVCLTVSNNEELCSEESDEMNCVTRPNPPSFIGYDSTNDSISAQLSPIPDSNEALTYKLFYASGGEVPANCDSSTSVCTVSNLPPATLYKVYSVICPDGPFNEKVCSEKSDDMYCATKPNKPSILNYASTNESITWEFGAIPESNATLTCKVHDDNGKELVECTDSSMPCMVSSLSPGTGYTVQLMVCVVVPYGYEQCSEKSEEMKCTTRPNPPSNVLVEPVSSSSVRVVLTTPEPATGIERYTVSLDGGDAIPCDIEEDERRRSCTISGLSPGTEYRVNAVSWLGGEFSSVSSEAAQGSGWTKLSKPSSWSYESTSDSITWQFSPGTESNGSLTYKVFDESGQQVAICSSSSLPCMASNLKPATVYPVYFLVCLTVSNNEELCSEESDEMNCVTRPNPPSPATCESRTSDSITWSYNTIDNSNENSWYKIVNENDHDLGVCDSSSLQCNGSGLSPATIYTGYLVVCFEGPNDEEVCSEKSEGVNCATEPNLSVTGLNSSALRVDWTEPSTWDGFDCFYIKMNGENLSDVSIKSLPTEITNLSADSPYNVCVSFWDGTVKETCSEVCSTGWTLLAAPSQTSKGIVDTTSVEVIWSSVSGNVNGYLATAEPVKSAEGVSTRTCENNASQGTSCTIRNLKPSTKYSVTVQAYKEKIQSNAKSGNSREGRSYGDPSIPFLVVTEVQSLMMRITMGQL
ncbi:hypothetical protein Aperf_G00000121483 [Anoplocephala perfoliata]